jgi:hypothetical protein
MAYSPINVLPDPVGALTTTEWPWLRASIASNWKSSRGKGNSWFGSSELDEIELAVIVEPYG